VLRHRDAEVQHAASGQGSGSQQEQVFETAVGEHSTIRLIDGSELTLNTNSRVRAEFGPAGRILRLERGELFVRVAHDASRPLTVLAGDRLVRAVGTAFNVEITPGQLVEVIVTDGKVLIGVAKTAATTEAAWVEDFSTPVLAGQRVVLGDEKPAVEQLESTEIDVKLSWREGNLVFHGEPLAEALGEIERYTRVTFVIRDEELKTVRIAGLFKAGDVDGLLATLRENFNISYERIGAEQIVLTSD
jgi:transmembrane sensor